MALRVRQARPCRPFRFLSEPGEARVREPEPPESRVIKCVTAALIAAFVVAPSASGGKFLWHRDHLSLAQKVNYFRLSVRHERQVIAFLQSKHAPRTLERHTELRWHQASLRWATFNLRHYSAKLAPHYSTAAAICSVFGAYCSQALAVARCESGLSVYATNGQYLGLFQMGDYARRRYGHGTDALTQARAAYAYFRDSGSDWSPWECKP